MRRCISIMLVMYLRSRSPSSALTSSWMASNSRPRSSICSGVRRVSGLSIRLGMYSSLAGSEFDFDRALGRVDAGADHLALLAMHLAGAQVADLTRAQAPHAGVADPHTTAVGQRGTRVLSGHEDRLCPVGLGVDVAVAEADRAAVSRLAVLATEVGLEVLNMQVVAVSELPLPVLGDRRQHVGWAGKEALALAPIGTQIVEIGVGDTAALSRVLLVQPEARVTPGDVAQLRPENHVATGARRMQMHRVGDPFPAVDAAQHAHDRGDAAPSADEQQLGWQWVGQHERALHTA